MKWIKRLFCKHEYEFVRNIYGDEINQLNYKRSECKCKKCGKLNIEMNYIMTNLAHINYVKNWINFMMNIMIKDMKIGKR